MSAEFELAPEFVDAMRYAACAFVVGPDADDPELFSGSVFRLAPSSERPRRLIPASDIARILRGAADQVEELGQPM